VWVARGRCGVSGREGTGVSGREGTGVSGREGTGVSGREGTGVSEAVGAGVTGEAEGVGVSGPVAARRGGRRSRRSGRRGGDSGTREAILAAARARFGDYGYDGATIRGIAADAGVDAALVHHFFGTKERLFAAAMRLPVLPSELLAAALAAGARDPGQSLGEHMLRTVLGAWDVAELRATFLGLLRSAMTSEQAAGMLREFATETILGRIAEVAAPGPPGGSAPPWWPARCSASPSPGTCSRSSRSPRPAPTIWPPRSARPSSAT
jgi:AcrR family transcriptional regulator